ncbi:hypothetical protein PROFUN_08515 [Planoprotostelium fungivorum]|uniref:F-box domain-containing protein n=1 Tax=Planoprotostelium fungivorum TaxID=1890364 RepID=A0A2P6NJB1_9EUKA|nr:hypothetical protein PROFUN_08515 [Planoprotostelium fungivorum]
MDLDIPQEHRLLHSDIFEASIRDDVDTLEVGQQHEIQLTFLFLLSFFWTANNGHPSWCPDLVMHRIIDHLHWSDILPLSRINRIWRRTALSNSVWAPIFYRLCCSFHHPPGTNYKYSAGWKIREGFFYHLCRHLFPDLLRATQTMSMLRPLDLQCSADEWKQQMKIGKMIKNAQRSHCYVPIEPSNDRNHPDYRKPVEDRTVFVCHRKKRTAFTY